MKHKILQLMVLAYLCGCALTAHAGDLRIPLPKGGRLTPVQELNRDGVKHLKRGQIDRAKQLFVRAYLLDPDDPFTLNNLGYVSELEGDAERALRYYQLAGSTNTDALIDEASSPGLKGQRVSEAFHSSNAAVLTSNKANLQALALLKKGRIFEAESLLKTAAQSDPNNPFLLDSLGYVMESEGDLSAALQYYSSAASLHSNERVLLTVRPSWRGKPISEVAAQSAHAVSETLAKGETNSARVARLNLRGVSALNHNDVATAQQSFSEAYKLDPENAFTINNMGYVAEINGDRETAEMYYTAARSAVATNERVTYATRRQAEGLRMGVLAEDNQVDIESRLSAIQEAKRRTRKPLILKRRDPITQPNSEPIQSAPLGVQMPPLPAPEPPGGTKEPPSEPSAPSGATPSPSTSQPPDGPQRR